MTTFSVNLNELIFTRNGNSNDLIVTGKDGQTIATEDGNELTSVTISDFKNNDTIATADYESVSIKKMQH
ncbi:hypothetical protein IJ182_10225 [bacterium]|nr:hypothetical protein [bacterium]